jgi:hypothetical protein
VAHKVGEGLLTRFNLGGGGIRGPGELSQSQSNPNFGKKDSIPSFRVGLGGVDKSTDFKLGASQKFNSQFSSGLSANFGLSQGGAVSQVKAPGMRSSVALGGRGEQELDDSMRKSNIMSSPSSKGGKNEEDEQ